MLPSIFTISNYFVFVIAVKKAFFFYFLMYFETFVVKLTLIHSARLTIVDKEVVPSLFVCFCYMIF